MTRTAALCATLSLAMISAVQAQGFFSPVALVAGAQYAQLIRVVLIRMIAVYALPE